MRVRICISAIVAIAVIVLKIAIAPMDDPYHTKLYEIAVTSIFGALIGVITYYFLSKLK